MASECDTIIKELEEINSLLETLERRRCCLIRQLEALGGAAYDIVEEEPLEALH
jgi:hypothetical protein